MVSYLGRSQSGMLLHADPHSRHSRSHGELALNPVEYRRSHWKQHVLPNFCPATFEQLSHYAQALHRMRRWPTLVIVFRRRAELFRLCNSKWMVPFG